MSTNINLKNSTDTTFSITNSDGANTKVLDSKDIVGSNDGTNFEATITIG